MRNAAVHHAPAQSRLRRFTVWGLDHRQIVRGPAQSRHSGFRTVRGSLNEISREECVAEGILHLQHSDVGIFKNNWAHLAQSLQLFGCRIRVGFIHEQISDPRDTKVGFELFIRKKRRRLQNGGGSLLEVTIESLSSHRASGNPRRHQIKIPARKRIHAPRFRRRFQKLLRHQKISPHRTIHFRREEWFRVNAHIQHGQKNHQNGERRNPRQNDRSGKGHGT